MSSGEATTEEAPEAPPVDTARQALVEALGDLVVDSAVAGGDVVVRVPTDRWHDAIATCKAKLDMDYFCFLSAIDWLNNPALAGEKAWGSLPEDDTASDASEDGEAAEGDGAEAEQAATVETGVAGGETRFQVFCRLYSLKAKLGITLKADAGDDNPTVQSITDLYRGADWHERETWEMYGVDFPGHPSLRHIYLPGGFEGHPGRKDFPLLAREVKPWPGLVDVEPLPGGDEESAEGGEG